MTASAPSASPLPGIFLLSLPRTGSTLLRLVLDTHPEISCPDEISLGRLASALYFTLGGLLESEEQATPIPRPRQGDPVLLETRRIVAGVMAQFVERKGKRLWCDKSPSNVDLLDLLGKAFPDARFILLHRHPFDMAASAINSTMYFQHMPIFEPYLRRFHPFYVPAYVSAWEEKSAELMRFEQEMGRRAFRIRYEDLVLQPERVLRRLFEFLGVAFDPALVDSVFLTPHHQRSNAGDPAAFQSTAITSQRVGAGSAMPWPAVRPIPYPLRERMNARLEQLGYPRVVFREDGYDTGMAAPAPSSASPAAAALPRPVMFKTFFEEVLPGRLLAQPDLAGQVRSSFRFVVSGEGGGSWLLDLTEPPGRVVPDGAGAGVEIAFDSADFAAALLDEIAPVDAFRRARFSPPVELAVAQKLILLFGATPLPGR